MIKKTVEYTDFNGDKQNDTLWFHVTRDRLTENMVTLRDDLVEVQNLLAGDTKQLDIPEIRKILDLIKSIVWLSYGERSEDGKRFRQTNEVWEDFRFSAAYDKLLTDFMEKPDEGMEFIQSVMPQDLMEQAEAQLKADGSLPEGGLAATANPVEPVTAAPRAMTREEMEQALAAMRTQG